MSVRAVLHAEIVTTGCSAELWLNDIPILRGNTGGVLVSKPVHLHLLDGRNFLRVVIGHGPTPGTMMQRSVTDVSDMDVFVRLVAYPLGIYPSVAAGQTLLQARWAGAAGQIIDQPIVIEDARDLGRLFGPRLWQGLPRLLANLELQREAVDLLWQLYRALADQDVQAYTALVAPRSQDAGAVFAARGLTKATDLGPYVASFGSGAALRLMPPDDKAFDFRLCGGGTMVELVNQDWLSSLRAQDAGGATVPLPVFAGRVNNRLLVVH